MNLNNYVQISPWKPLPFEYVRCDHDGIKFCVSSPPKNTISIIFFFPGAVVIVTVMVKNKFLERSSREN